VWNKPTYRKIKTLMNNDSQSGNGLAFLLRLKTFIIILIFI
jgi:hypothetical protein